MPTIITADRVSGSFTSTGSLGHGLPFGCGLALNKLIYNRKNKVYVLLSDGECNEGSVWEAAMSASHFKLNNITVFIDNNNFQQKTINNLESQNNIKNNYSNSQMEEFNNLLALNLKKINEYNLIRNE